ncbi:hypothetical protein Riv7116_6503 [Rivularia sp. PCC 7116]|nr:hypothetical protein Riv7116_6503 [Rivularia sp. PCC 7116]
MSKSKDRIDYENYVFINYFFKNYINKKWLKLLRIQCYAEQVIQDISNIAQIRGISNINF